MESGLQYGRLGAREDARKEVREDKGCEAAPAPPEPAAGREGERRSEVGVM